MNSGLPWSALAYAVQSHRISATGDTSSLWRKSERLVRHAPRWWRFLL